MKQKFKIHFKKIVLNRLQRRVKQYFVNNPSVKLIAISGSVGKTSTKYAVSTILSQKYHVISQEGNHNSEVSVPLAILGIPLPDDLTSISMWRAVLKEAKLRSRKDSMAVEVVIIELGTDKPGDLASFGSYLNPDLTVITAVSAEHMEYFGTLDGVAKEELSVGDFSKAVLINRDDTDEQYSKYLNATDIDTYGMGGTAEYYFLITSIDEQGGAIGSMVTPTYGQQPMHLHVLGEHSIKPVVGAVAVGIRLGLTIDELNKGVEAIRPVPGRMQPLVGVEESLLIDDTYNSSPLAAIAALQTLYNFPNQQRIAVLGSMNEMGNYSKQAHELVAAACDPTLLDWVVTIGEEAEKYLGVAARGRGCQVKSFHSPIEAGGFVHSVLHPKAVVLLKGSQNNVYAEEATKILLEHSADEDRLVRQSAEWMAKKNEFLSKF